ncbi:hypothetical protein OOZ15_13445 [Galbibacter sp. EGI 63066]|uniref:hypothetical protein n=1 Tax=Galbibacter sp. EGI 63066 TaxID=2993559 RepID=UPI002248DD47|nr:hypothetical protein [Galbibacter sp. EGI 63066]MCX2680952.1 hypothetical protein [Galbibacter sp. EGI 63066]
MKNIFTLLVIGMMTFTSFSQSNTALSKHFESYYEQMKEQGDMRGVINALTHLNVLSPSEARKDTLAYFYSKAGQYRQALSILGTEKNTSDSDIAIEVKAISLKALNQPQLAVQQFDIMFSRKPDVFLAYELADLNLQIGKIVEAQTYIKYGLENTKEDDMLPFYEANPPYQVPLKAALTYQQGLLKYNQDKTKIDEALKFIDQAITMAPEFKLAKQIKELLQNQKQAAAQETTTPQNQED